MNMLTLLTCSDNDHKHIPRLSHALTGYEACAHTTVVGVNIIIVAFYVSN
jgi:hypothetical protein